MLWSSRPYLLPFTSISFGQKIYMFLQHSCFHIFHFHANSPIQKVNVLILIKLSDQSIVQLHHNYPITLPQPSHPHTPAKQWESQGRVRGELRESSKDIQHSLSITYIKNGIVHPLQNFSARTRLTNHYFIRTQIAEIIRSKCIRNAVPQPSASIF